MNRLSCAAKSLSPLFPDYRWIRTSKARTKMIKDHSSVLTPITCSARCSRATLTTRRIGNPLIARVRSAGRDSESAEGRAAAARGRSVDDTAPVTRERCYLHVALVATVFHLCHFKMSRDIVAVGFADCQYFLSAVNGDPLAKHFPRRIDKRAGAVGADGIWPDVRAGREHTVSAGGLGGSGRASSVEREDSGGQEIASRNVSGSLENEDALHISYRAAGALIVPVCVSCDTVIFDPFSAGGLDVHAHDSIAAAGDDDFFDRRARRIEDLSRAIVSDAVGVLDVHVREHAIRTERFVAGYVSDRVERDDPDGGGVRIGNGMTVPENAIRAVESGVGAAGVLSGCDRCEAEGQQSKDHYAFVVHDHPFWGSLTQNICA